MVIMGFDISLSATDYLQQVGQFLYAGMERKQSNLSVHVFTAFRQSRASSILASLPALVVPPPVFDGFEEIRIDFEQFLNGNALFIAEINNYIPIPKEYEADPILSQYICPITSSLIRHPVTLRQVGAVFHFERAGIFAWVQMCVKNHLVVTNPCTQEPIALCQMLVNFELQKLIDNHLAMLQTGKENSLGS